jgi:hypothetical protein
MRSEALTAMKAMMYTLVDIYEHYTGNLPTELCGITPQKTTILRDAKLCEISTWYRNGSVIEFTFCERILYFLEYLGFIFLFIFLRFAEFIKSPLRNASCCLFILYKFL